MERERQRQRDRERETERDSKGEPRPLTLYDLPGLSDNVVVVDAW